MTAAPEPRRTPAYSGPDPAEHLLALGYADTISAAQAKAIADNEMEVLRDNAASHLARGEWPRAIAALEQQLQRVPDDYRANLELGQVLLRFHDLARARPHANAALAARPELPWPHLLMGTWHVASGDPEAAEPHLLRARALGSTAPLVNLRLGWSAIILRRWAEAEESFRTVIAAESSIDEAHLGLGVALQGQGRMDEAEAALRRSIGLAHDNPVAHFHLGQVLAARHAYAAAAAALRIAIRQNPGLAEAADLLTRVEQAHAGKLAKIAAARPGELR